MSDALPHCPSSELLGACGSSIRQPVMSSVPAVCEIASSTPLLAPDFSGEHGGAGGGWCFCGGQRKGPLLEGALQKEQLALIDSPLSKAATRTTRVNAEVRTLEFERSPVKVFSANGVKTQADPSGKGPSSRSSAGEPPAADMTPASKRSFRADAKAVVACYSEVEGCTALEAKAGPQPPPATPPSASKGNRAAAAEAGSFVQELSVAVPSEENMFHGDVGGMQLPEAGPPLSALQEASPSGSLSRTDVVSAVPESAAGSQTAQEELACSTIARTEALKARRGKAPGAPPSKRGFYGKAKKELACKGEASCVTEDFDKTCRLWGWRPAGEPLTTLRGCCTDHLLVEGKCSCTGEPSSDGNLSDSSRDLTTEVCPNSLKTSWLLDLEAIVHSSLKDCQQQAHLDCPPTPKGGAARDVLNSFVEEIGFSGGFFLCE